MRSWSARNVIAKYRARSLSLAAPFRFPVARCVPACGCAEKSFSSYGSYPVKFGALGSYRGLSVAVEARDQPPADNHVNNHANILLALNSCNGCGAPVQLIHPDDAGFFSKSRKAVNAWIKHRVEENHHAAWFNETALPPHITRQQEDNDVRLNDEPPQPNSQSEIAEKNETAPVNHPPKVPVCDRCHRLLHHSVGEPIYHPSMLSIADTISESPHKYNHVYHLIDAADFPLSLVPNIGRLLAASPQRSRNRRSKHESFHRGRKTELSFIITRSDLLAPRKEQVDALMPQLVEVLRDVLGSSGKHVRLGNVRCVSAKRGWWTRVLKTQIWERGGGGWMVGKVNVGKSNLFEVVFPKGGRPNALQLPVPIEASPEGSEDAILDGTRDTKLDGHSNTTKIFEVRDIDEQPDQGILLPPPRPETAYPEMPTISALPGTTASPIRIPFGTGKGELIDLPGLSRSNLHTFVQPEHQNKLVMTSRISPEQYSIKPGQCLLLGGLFCIIPKDPNLTILAYPFVPFEAHVTSTEKALGYMRGERQIGVPVIAKDSIRNQIISAGSFPLRWDVTKQRAGPLTSRSAVHLKPEVLPFQVLSADILIEGCGWVELVVQVRKCNKGTSDDPTIDFHNLPAFPEVEILSPEGKYVDVRRPLGAWLLGGRVPLSATKRKARPRRNMRSMKGSSVRHADKAFQLA